MSEPSVPAMAGTDYHRDHPLTRSLAGMIGFGVLLTLVLLCLLTIPYTFGKGRGESPRYDDQRLSAFMLPPSWASHTEDEARRRSKAASEIASERILLSYLEDNGVTEVPDGVDLPAPTDAQVADAMPFYWMGTDSLGRPLLTRCLAGGGISIGIGLSAAAISVFIGTLYGALAGYLGGKADALMMRIVDILYGLPYILLVVLLAVAGEAVLDEVISRSSARRAFAEEQTSMVVAWLGTERLGVSEDAIASQIDQDASEVRAGSATISEWAADDADFSEVLAQIEAAAVPLLERETTASGRAAVLENVASNDDGLAAWVNVRADQVPRLKKLPVSATQQKLFEVGILLVAIGGVSWLTMARVIRGQVLSLKAQPFMEAARAIGVPVQRQFAQHLLPNLLGPIIVYTTLTVPQAILQESFLSFLGIGVRPPLPSWGNLAAEGLIQLNPVVVRWWLILFPCLLLGATLLALNFVGEGLREAFDPKRAKK